MWQFKLQFYHELCYVNHFHWQCVQKHFLTNSNVIRFIFWVYKCIFIRIISRPSPHFRVISSFPTSCLCNFLYTCADVMSFSLIISQLPICSEYLLPYFFSEDFFAIHSAFIIIEASPFHLFFCLMWIFV